MYYCTLYTRKTTYIIFNLPFYTWLPLDSFQRLFNCTLLYLLKYSIADAKSSESVKLVDIIIRTNAWSRSVWWFIHSIHACMQRTMNDLTFDFWLTIIFHYRLLYSARTRTDTVLIYCKCSVVDDWSKYVPDDLVC